MLNGEILTRNGVTSVCIMNSNVKQKLFIRLCIGQKLVNKVFHVSNIPANLIDVVPILFRSLKVEFVDICGSNVLLANNT